jgi:hypothetical protein
MDNQNEPIPKKERVMQQVRGLLGIKLHTHLEESIQDG